MNNNDATNTNIGILLQIGIFIKEMRISQNKTQQQLADACGINRSTYIQIENGKGSSMLHFVQVLRALGALHLLNIFETQMQTISPIALAKAQQKKRQRASKTTTNTIVK
jgi:transcriptional regulator with XRE-family HTH domain